MRAAAPTSSHASRPGAIGRLAERREPAVDRRAGAPRPAAARRACDALRGSALHELLRLRLALALGLDQLLEQVPHLGALRRAQAR